MDHVRKRRSKFINADNCSVVQTDDQRRVFVLGYEVYATIGSEVDYAGDRCACYVKEANTSEHSLNQATTPKAMYVPINIFMEIQDAFNEMEKELERLLSGKA